jgi:hypothetical protein
MTKQRFFYASHPRQATGCINCRLIRNADSTATRWPLKWRSYYITSSEVRLADQLFL